MNAYKATQDIALADLAPTHLIRLGPTLNFSVFYYEILNTRDRACNLAKQCCNGGGGAGREGDGIATATIMLVGDNCTRGCQFWNLPHRMPWSL